MLIQYGLMRGLIRHLQKYPVLVGSEASEESSSDSLQPYLKYTKRAASAICVLVARYFMCIRSIPYSLHIADTWMVLTAMMKYAVH